MLYPMDSNFSIKEILRVKMFTVIIKLEENQSPFVLKLEEKKYMSAGSSAVFMDPFKCRLPPRSLKLFVVNEMIGHFNGQVEECGDRRCSTILSAIGK